jgi:peptidoglycan/LPS O-acetylase OafA/YrhL
MGRSADADTLDATSWPGAAATTKGGVRVLDQQVMQSRSHASDTAVRTDIQALRALAVGMVVLYHLWPGRLRGGFVGVDVFFVISGFLITSHLLRSPPSGIRDLAAFWARRVRRLLPASFLVLGAAFAATLLLAPRTAWSSSLREIGASALYVENWSLAAQSVDYLGAEEAPTLVQHFWSLSVEEQFYLVWPVLLVACGWLAVRLRRRPGPLYFAGIGALCAASLTYSVVATARQPAAAYFVTPTRLWELGAGAVLAAASAWNWRPLALHVRTAVTWAGLGLIAFTCVTYTGSTPFPGWRALLPVLGTVLVIAAKPEHGPLSPRPLMDLRPVQWLGDVSYSIYLWHWPLIVLAPFVLGRNAGLLDRVVIFVATLILAGLSKTFVEDRFRRGRQGVRRVLLTAVVASLVTASTCGLLVHQLDQGSRQRREQLARALENPSACLGAAVLDPGRNCPAQPELLGPSDAKADKPTAYADHCWEGPPFDGLATCRYGDMKSPVQIALIGNSHAGNLLPALQRLADRHGWGLTTLVASRCPTSTTKWQFPRSTDADGCLAWGGRVLKRLRDSHFDLVVTQQLTPYGAQGASSAADSDAMVEAGYRQYLTRVLDAGSRVLVVRDTPYPKNTIPSVPDCVAQHEHDSSACDGKKSEWLKPDPLYAAAKSIHDPAMSSIDLTPHVCTGNICPAVAGGMVVYFDASHLTASYAVTLAPYLEPTLVHLLPGG